MFCVEWIMDKDIQLQNYIGRLMGRVKKYLGRLEYPVGNALASILVKGMLPFSLPFFI